LGPSRSHPAVAPSTYRSSWAGHGAIPSLCISGSPQELVKCCILRGFPDLLKSHVFRVGDGHALGFQQQVAYVGVAAPAVDQHADIAVDGLDDSKAHLGAAIVQNPVEVLDQHGGELRKW